MRVGLDSRSRPTAESCNAAIAVEENASDSNFYRSILLHNVGVEGLALAYQKPQSPKIPLTAETNYPKFKTSLVFKHFCTHSG